MTRTQKHLFELAAEQVRHRLGTDPDVVEVLAHVADLHAELRVLHGELDAARRTIADRDAELRALADGRRREGGPEGRGNGAPPLPTREP
jgi:hypothetical protein